MNGGLCFPSHCLLSTQKCSDRFIMKNACDINGSKAKKKHEDFLTFDDASLTLMNNSHLPLPNEQSPERHVGKKGSYL